MALNPEDPLLPLARLAQDRPELRSAARQPAVPEARREQKYPKLSVRDAVHAASMLRNGLKRVISVDADFDQIREIRRIEPDAA
ncbi:MAG: PIN domain-containing protein [Thermoanaerobaculia bacterium]